MDVVPIIVGAIVGAFVSVPVVIFIQEPLLHLGRRALAGFKQSGEGGLMAALDEKTRERDQKARELEALEQELGRARAYLASLGEQKAEGGKT